jgi:site-specific DNA-methyltransferase (cytosine-N4-specific)
MEVSNGKALSTAAVAQRAGVHKDTVLRWLREKKIAEPARDGNGWRVFSQAEAQRIERFANFVTNAPIQTDERVAELHRLEAIDWDFANAKTSYLTHGLHPYPAKYIPQIPNALIQELSSVGETVADIFCGSGTTLVEALTLKRNAVGIDANPLACLISEAKTAQLSTGELELLRQIAVKSLTLALSIADGEGTLFPNRFFTSTAPRPSFDAISFWFEPFIIEELAEILSWCKAIASDGARNVALTAFSAIVVNVSKQDSDTRYVRREKNLRRGDAFKRFARALSDCAHAVEEFTELIEPRFSCKVLCSNVLDSPDVDRFDLVVCSPPYPNAYSYHLYHMTRMLWLGMDQPTFKRVEIGSHRKYSAKSASIETFRTEMEGIFAWLGRRLRIGRFVCFVVGSSIIKGEQFHNADLISEVASNKGFKEVSRIHRRMQDTKKAFNPAIGKIKTEQIVILQCREGAA